MNHNDNHALKLELKQLIVEECDKHVDPAQITDSEPLFGPRAPLDLDSLDGLQISMALQTRYGVVVTDPKQVRRILKSVNTLADFLQQARPSP